MTAYLTVPSSFSAETREKQRKSKEVEKKVLTVHVRTQELGNIEKEGGSGCRGQTAEDEKNPKMILSLK